MNSQRDRNPRLGCLILVVSCSLFWGLVIWWLT